MAVVSALVMCIAKAEETPHVAAAPSDPTPAAALPRICYTPAPRG